MVAQGPESSPPALKAWVTSFHLKPQNSVKRIEFWSQQTWVRIPALPCTCCVALDKLDDLSDLIIKTWQWSLPHWVIGELNEIMTSSSEPDRLRGLINVHVLCIKKR